VTVPASAAPPAASGPVAFLGPEGTFTSQVADRVAPTAKRLPLASIPAVIDAVRDGRAPLGVVPIENSIEGSVNLTLDALAFGADGVYIRAEIAVPIVLALLALPGAGIEGLREVRSKDVAIGQCQAWLAAHLPSAQLVPTSSTAEAARQVVATGRTDVAALAPLQAARDLGLEVIADSVADRPGNTTRFVVLGPAPVAATGADKTSLVVFFGEDRPGLLLRVLEEFALRGVNLVKIESRPTKQQLGEYCILIDCEGHPSEARVGEALRGIHRHVAGLRVLGAYPRADQAPVAAEPSDSDAAYEAATRWHQSLLARIR